MENWMASCSGKREKISSERVQNWIATPRKILEITSEGMEDRQKGRREKKHTTTTNAVDVIVKDLMDDILRKLPRRNLVRFRCVCKAWNNFIPRIAKSTHGPRKIIVTPHHSGPCKCVKIVDIDAAVAALSNTGTYPDSEPEEIIQEISLLSPYKLVGSWNGLLLIVFETKWRNFFVLWNPLILDFNFLPSLEPPSVMLRFWSSMIGFGYDGCSADYKVVRIFAYEDSSFGAVVLSVKTNRLRYSKLEQPFSNDTIYKFLKYDPSMGNLVNGALYWAVSDFDYGDQSFNDDSDWFEDHFNRTDRSHRLRFRILRFDLADEKFSWMQAPLNVDPQFNLRLMVFEGNELCAYQTDFVIKMWVLEGDKEIEKDELWAEFMRIPFYQGRIGTERNYAPLAFMRDGKVLIVRFLAYEDFSLEVLVHSLKTNSWRNLELEEPYFSNNIHEVLEFTPRMGTLVNGALYCPVSNFYSLPDIKYQILRFQLAGEKHSWVQAPKAIHKYCRLRLMVFEGKLFAYQNVLFDNMIEMWVLKYDQETGPEWTKLMSIPIAKNRTNQGRNLAPLSFMKDGEVLLCRNKLSGSQGCRLYNPKSNKFRTLEILGMEGWFNQQFIYEESVESLAPYDGNKNEIKER
ncbi:hypothetical protein FNV43_RR00906 [Rhamnella rubrinervis]|uniref:F-box domain-containing protein n=1 Tax=Rhamnella rubrinervis TaxID=2594499 RepID=A0A8K0HNN0_9ROSA|nr:hypothetical protein FNV43_RR00906 [Rhamnella rubrinervis]